MKTNCAISWIAKCGAMDKIYNTIYQKKYKNSFLKSYCFKYTNSILKFYVSIK